MTAVYVVAWFGPSHASEVAAGGHGAHEPVAADAAASGSSASSPTSSIRLGIGSFAHDDDARSSSGSSFPISRSPERSTLDTCCRRSFKRSSSSPASASSFKRSFFMIAAACAGAWLGAGVVAGFSRRRCKWGWALRCWARPLVVLAQLLNIVPAGEALALTGTKLAIGVTVNFILGALMTLGVGLYAPAWC